MKALKALFCVTLLSITTSAFSGVIVDTVDVNKDIGHWGYTKYVHDLSDHDFILGSAISGSLAISIQDDNDWYLEKAFFIIEKLDFDSEGWTYGQSYYDDELGINAIGELNKDGQLRIKIASIWGDFKVGTSVLTVITEVPEPASLALFTLGIASLFGLRRRKNITA
ncbi:PEP-CTERM sorting domain-containing protein [Reinekea forsetii]|nr:PEP-CTERM sorting domain-containing protein [Reinekea forsetii]